MAILKLQNRTKIVSGKKAALIALLATGVAFFVLAWTLPTLAEVMSSTNYKLQSDSDNSGGGRSSSASYGLESTTGETATGPSSSSNYTIQAGFQQQDQSQISIGTIADVVMSPSLGGLTGGTSTGATTILVTTTNPAGYTMTIKASSSPAMQGNTQANDIADYTPLVPGIPDFSYSVPTSYEFGYSVSASTTADLAQKFKDDGSSSCNTGSLDTNASSTCWYGLSTTATSTILRSSATPSGGATTTLFFRLTVNVNSAPTEDSYNATTTITAIQL